MSLKKKKKQPNQSSILIIYISLSFHFFFSISSFYTLFLCFIWVIWKDFNRQMLLHSQFANMTDIIKLKAITTDVPSHMQIIQSFMIGTISKVSKLATVVEGDPKDPFSIATTPRCRGGCYSLPLIVLLYSSYVPYPEC